MKRLAPTIFLAVLVATGSASAASYSVIVNPDNPISDLSSSELRDIFEGDVQSWSGGSSIVLLVPGKPVTYDMLLSTVYRRNAEQMRRHWVAKIYRGEITEEPETVVSPAVVLRRVSDLRGAISIVPSELVSIDVKVLRIDGLLPGEAGYALVDDRGLY